jgi:hypothetical protein
LPSNFSQLGEGVCPGAELNHRHCDFQSLAKVGCPMPGRLGNGCIPPYFAPSAPPGLLEMLRTFQERLRTFTQDLHARRGSLLGAKEESEATPASAHSDGLWKLKRGRSHHVADRRYDARRQAIANRESVSQALGRVRQAATICCRRQILSIGAGCLNWARPDLCGGTGVTRFPTAIKGAALAHGPAAVSIRISA